MEDDADLREQLFLNTVRENIVSNIANSPLSVENARPRRAARVEFLASSCVQKKNLRRHTILSSECGALCGNPTEIHAFLTVVTIDPSGISTKN